MEINLQTVGDKKHILCFFISLKACYKGFLVGCRPYNTNNISETFNSWVGDIRYKPMLDLLDGIRVWLWKDLTRKGAR